MKAAVIGDIHANLPALERVLDHAHGQGVESIWNVGDSVGYGPFPEEVVQRLQRDYVLSTIGSQDRKILRFKKRQEDELLAPIGFLYEKYRDTARSEKREDAVNWLMGQVQRQAVGNIPLAMLKYKIEEKINHL